MRRVAGKDITQSVASLTVVFISICNLIGESFNYLCYYGTNKVGEKVSEKQEDTKGKQDRQSFLPFTTHLRMCISKGSKQLCPKGTSSEE